MKNYLERNNLAVGTFYRGPERKDKANQGFRPVIVRSKRFFDLRKLHPKKFPLYAVGMECDLSNSINLRCWNNIDSVEIEGRTIKFFRTFEAAKKYFQKICVEVESHNKKIRASRRKVNSHGQYLLF